jgi:hypothetical protein
MLLKNFSGAVEIERRGYILFLQPHLAQLCIMALVAQDNRSKMQKELEEYVQSVATLEYENSELKSRLAELEAERERDIDAWTEKMKSAKVMWREQALTFGNKQREKAIKECEIVMLRFQSELRTQRFATDEGSRASIISALIRSRYNEDNLKRSVAMHDMTANTGMATSQVGVQDFDIDDRHIGIYNRTDHRVNLTGCSIRFREAGLLYRIPDDTVVQPHSIVSIWYGKDHTHLRRAKEVGSILWSSDVTLSLSSKEVAELVDRKGVVRSFVQCTESAAATAATSASSVESKPTAAGKSASSSRAATIKGENVKDEKTLSNSSSSSRRKRERESEKDLEEIHDLLEGPGEGFTPPTKLSRKSHQQDLTEPEEHQLPVEQRPSAPASLHSLCDPLAYAAPRPFLHGRQQGALQVEAVLKGGFKIGIRLRNRSNHAVDISGWKLICLGYPVQELLIPKGTVIPSHGPLGLVSQLDETAKLLVRGIAADVTGAGKREIKVTAGEEKAQTGSAGTGTDRSSIEWKEAVEVSEADKFFSEAHIVEVVGLNTLPICDVFTICLVDTHHENICQFDAASSEVDVFGERNKQHINTRTWRSWLVPAYRTVQNVVAPFLFELPGGGASSGGGSGGGDVASTCVTM